jgi:xyloglucan-specific exo-beta-1,4-glucanase
VHNRLCAHSEGLDLQKENGMLGFIHLVAKKYMAFILVLLLVLGTYANTYANDNYSWGSVAIGGGGFVNAVLAHPNEENLIYARTDVGGAYRWNEADHSWIPLQDWVSSDETSWLGVDGLAMDPQDPSRLYLFVGTSYWNGGKTAILRSTDYGNSFAVTDVTTQFKTNGNSMGRQNGERIAVDPNLGSVIMVGSRSDGLFISMDYGETFGPVANFPVTTTPNGKGIVFVAFDPASGQPGQRSQTIIVGVSQAGVQNLYITQDAGQTWKAMDNQPTTYLPMRADYGINGYLYITYADAEGPHNSGEGAAYKLNLSTLAFTDITPLLSNGANPSLSGISVSKTNPQHIIATTINFYWSQPWGWGDRILESKDGGSTWQDLIGASRVQMDVNGNPWIQGHAIHWAGSAMIDPYNDNRVFITSGNGIFMSDNLHQDMTTWKFMVKGLEETVPFDVVSLPGGPMVSVIGDYDGFVHYDIKVPAPKRHSPGMGSTQGLTAAHNNIARVARLQNKLYVSNDTASTWEEWPLPSAEPARKLAFSLDGQVLLLSFNNGTMYRTADDGANWSVVPSIQNATSPVADGYNPNTFYAYHANSGTFYTSSDKGASFSVQTSPGSWGANSIRTVPGHEGHVFVAMHGNGLSYTENGGTSFRKISNIEVCNAIGLGMAAPGKTYPTLFIWGRPFQETSGIWRSIDRGASWVRVNDDDHEFGGMANGQFVKGDWNVFGRVYMSTAGRGIIYGETSEVFAIDPPTNITLSRDTVLDQAPAATLVGVLTTQDNSTNEVFAYDFVLGDGDEDNDKFSLSNDSLYTTVPLNYSWAPTRSIRIGVTDKDGQSLQKSFTIYIAVEEAPVTLRQSITHKNPPEFMVPAVVFDLKGRLVE